MVDGGGLGAGVDASVRGEVTEVSELAVEELVAALLLNAAQPVRTTALTIRIDVHASTRRPRRAGTEVLGVDMMVSFPATIPVKPAGG